MRKKFEILDVIQNKYYFGIGGIGDFLLLMSTFYDDVTPNTDVVFVANNVKAISGVAELFGGVNKFWIYPRKAFEPSTRIYNELLEDWANYKCLGMGVTPENFDYVGDWMKCADEDVFEYYGVKEHCDFFFKLKKMLEPHITVQPYGGEDANRISEMSVESITHIINKFPHYKIFLIGSNDDIKRMGFIENTQWVTRFDESFHKIRTAEFHIGVNSWCKTLSGLLDVETYIWPSEYRKPPIKVYGTDKDPADYVFLKEAGWKFKDAKELIYGKE